MVLNHTDNRAAKRYEVDAPVEGAIGDHAFTGRLKDISATGAAIVGVDDVGYENDQFVQLHMNGVETQSGYIKRRIPEGFALQFDSNDNEEKRKRDVQEMLRKLGPDAMRG